MNEMVKVFCLDGMAGWLKKAIIDPITGQPTHIIIRSRQSEGNDVTISTHMIRNVGNDVQLGINLKAIEILPHHPADQDCEPVEKGFDFSQ